MLYNIVFGHNMAESKPGLRKPVFTKIDQLRPGTNGHTLTVKVVESKMVVQKGRPDGPHVRQMRIAECLVGDETGTIIFTARNEQGSIFTLLTDLLVKSYCRVMLFFYFCMAMCNFKYALSLLTSAVFFPAVLVIYTIVKALKGKAFTFGFAF